MKIPYEAAMNRDTEELRDLIKTAKMLSAEQKELKAKMIIAVRRGERLYDSLSDNNGLYDGVIDSVMTESSNITEKLTGFMQDNDSVHDMDTLAHGLRYLARLHKNIRLRPTDYAAQVERKITSHYDGVDVFEYLTTVKNQIQEVKQKHKYIRSVSRYKIGIHALLPTFVFKDMPNITPAWRLEDLGSPVSSSEFNYSYLDQQIFLAISKRAVHLNAYLSIRQAVYHCAEPFWYNPIKRVLAEHTYYTL